MASEKNQAVKKTAGKKGSDYGAVVVRGEHLKGVKPRYMAKFSDKVLPELKKLHTNKNVMELPKIVKIVVNTCQGEATQNIKALEAAAAELEIITGQKAVITRAKKSIATFKLRAGMPIGASVTLRKERMFEFYDKLVSVALPRVRDFRGVSSNSFDGRGNYSLGIREQIIFPEIEADKVDKTRGLSITIVTSAKTDEEARELLTLLDMPFRK
ncbi:50S ribosomal protein L5 [Spirobacillus cienkowskii]|jgi:large subunit ribosomal protein L5